MTRNESCIVAVYIVVFVKDLQQVQITSSGIPNRGSRGKIRFAGEIVIVVLIR